MAAASIVSSRFHFVGGAVDADRCRHAPVPDGPRDEAFATLVEQIRHIEGEAVCDPPLLFKLVVAGGAVVTAAASLGSASWLLGLLARLAA